MSTADNSDETLRPDWSDLPPLLFEHVIARVIDVAPATASTLLCVSSRFHRAACRALYEELTLIDDENELIRPKRHSQLEALVRYPVYASYVRSLTLLGRPPMPNEDSESSFFSFVPQRRGPPMRPETLANLLSGFERLEAFTWMTNTVPDDELCYLLASATPGLSTLIVRPKLPHDAAAATPSQWNPRGLHKLPCLRELSLSRLSTEGGKTLAAALPYVRYLEYLTIDMATVGDVLLATVAAECKRLVDITIRTTSTKASDAGIAALLSGCKQLRSLTLSDCQGRFSSKLWPSLHARLPASLTKFGVAFNEVGPPHHTWVVDHVAGIFHMLAAAPQGLTHFSVTRIIPPAAAVSAASAATAPTAAQQTLDGLGLSIGMAAVHLGSATATSFIPACEDIVAPRRLPSGALALLTKHGDKLRELELDFFTLDIDELRAILLACLKLERLRVHVDAPLSQILAMSPVFVPLTELQVFEFSLTEAHCPRSPPPSPQQQQQHYFPTLPPPQSTSGFTSAFNSPPSMSEARLQSSTAALNAIAAAWPDAAVSPTLSRTSDTSIFSDLSPSSTATSLFSESGGAAHDTVPPAPSAPGSSPKKMRARRRSSLTNDEALNVGKFDNSVPSDRMVRKFARRCHKLKVMRWTGRAAVGEWRVNITKQASVEFVPLSSLPQTSGSLEEPHCGDASLLRRRTSSTAALKEKTPIGYSDVDDSDDDAASAAALDDIDESVSSPATLSVPYSLPTPALLQHQRPVKAEASQLDAAPTAMLAESNNSLAHRRSSAPEASAAHASSPTKLASGSARQWSVVKGSRLQAQQAASQSIANAQSAAASGASAAPRHRRRARDSSGNVIIGHGRKEKYKASKAPYPTSTLSAAAKTKSRVPPSSPPAPPALPSPSCDSTPDDKPTKPSTLTEPIPVRRFVPGSGMPDQRGDGVQEAITTSSALPSFAFTSRRPGPSAPGSINGGVTRKTTHLKRMTSRGGSAAGANTQAPHKRK